jgi:hypothetical protein
METIYYVYGYPKYGFRACREKRKTKCDTLLEAQLMKQSFRNEGFGRSYIKPYTPKISPGTGSLNTNDL